MLWHRVCDCWTREHWSLEPPPRHCPRLHQTDCGSRNLKMSLCGFEPDDIYHYTVDSVDFITGKFGQMHSCFLVESLSSSLLQMNFAQSKFWFQEQQPRTEVWIWDGNKLTSHSMEERSISASEHDITFFHGDKSDDPKDTWDQMSLYFVTKKLQSNELRENARGINESGYVSCWWTNRYYCVLRR